MTSADDDLIRALRGDLTAMAAGSDVTEPYVVTWRDLDEAVAAAEIDRLGQWVRWICVRYCLDHKTIPPCWSDHGALTEELSALRTLWELCYLGDAAPADPATFHRELDSTLRRLREWSSRRGCTRTDHRPDPT